MSTKHIREVEKLVAQFTNDFDIEISRGNHLKVVMRCGSEKRTLFCSKTPSDHKTIKNFSSTVRKAYGEISKGSAVVLRF